MKLAKRIRNRLRRLPGLRVGFGGIGGTRPISDSFGFDRGTPIDRFYIEQFLAEHAALIAGRTLEIGDDAYTTRFGGARATRRDVLHVHASNPAATIVGDLSVHGTLPADAFDCAVITQTIHLIWDMEAAVRELRRSLRPGGTLLLTTPGITSVDRTEWNPSWYWSLTLQSARKLFDDAFGPENVAITCHGNVFAACAFLQGLALEEVPRRKLRPVDPSYPVIITVRATRAR